MDYQHPHYGFIFLVNKQQVTRIPSLLHHQKLKCILLSSANIPACRSLSLSYIICVCIEAEDLHGESGRESAGVHPHGRVAQVRPLMFAVTGKQCILNILAQFSANKVSLSEEE